MKKNILVCITTLILVAIIISSLVVYAKSNEKQPSLEEKITDEIKYLDSYIISLLGHFNGLTIGDDIFQTSQPKTQLGKQQESNPQNTISQNEQSSGQQSESTNNMQSQQENQEGNVQANQTQTKGGEAQSGQGTNLTQNGIFSNNGNYEANWKIIELRIEQLYQTWNSISIDLHALGMEGSSILAFSDNLNDITQKIKKKDKEKAVEQLAKLYELLPKYLESYSKDNQKIQLLTIQSQIITAYSQVTNEKWKQAATTLAQTEEQFANILNTVTKQNNQNQTVMNQCYILTNELKNAVNLKDKDIFYIQYQNFITKMATLI